MLWQLFSRSTVVGMFSRMLRERAGNVAVIFAVAAVPLVVGAGGAVDYSTANSARTGMQNALDSTALNLIRTAASQTSGALGSNATALFNAQFKKTGVSGVTVGAQYDSASGILTLNASGTVQMSLMQVVGIKTMSVGAMSKAKVGGSQLWQVCVLVTDPDSNHTLLVKSQASIDFSNCMVQVNTQNWDAVEARDTSYIHSVNGVNCFTGDIHYGDVTPPKQPTCTMLTDPFASYTLPDSLNTCTYTNLNVKTDGTILSPGTYCNGLQLQANTTFSPGLYVIKDGQFKVQNVSSITATGVTFVLTGKNAGLDIDMSKYNGTFNITPDMGSDAGQYAGFLFFLDQTPDKNGHMQYQNQSTLSGVTMNTHGTVYLTGQQFNLKQGSNITLNTGSIIAGFILPDSSQLNLTGSVNGAQLTKALDSTIPVLVQ